MLNFPPELTDAVFINLKPPFHTGNLDGTSHATYQVVKEDLCTCSLVCHSWRALAQWHLFQDVRVSFQSADDTGMILAASRCKAISGSGKPDNRVKTLAAFYTFLDQSPHIGAIIRKLRLVFAPRSSIHSVFQWPSWTTADHPSKSLLLAILDKALLPNLRHLELHDVYLNSQIGSSSPFAPRAENGAHDVVSALEELHIHCQSIHIVGLPELVNLLSLFGSIERLYLSGSPAIQSGHGHTGMISSGNNLRPKHLTVSDSSCYGPLLTRLSASPAAMHIRSVQAGIGASTKANWFSGLAELLQSIGPHLEHLAYSNVLQPVPYEVLNSAPYAGLETLSFHFNLAECLWLPLDLKNRRWKSIYGLLSSIFASRRDWPELHTIIFVLLGPDENPSAQSFSSFINDAVATLPDVDEALVQLIQGWDLKWKKEEQKRSAYSVELRPLRIAFVSSIGSGVKSRLPVTVEMRQSLQLALPGLAKMGVLQI